jgi:hypothetical protein
MRSLFEAFGTAGGLRARAGELQVRLRGGKRSLAGMPGLIPDADPGWETALLLPVPAAEPAVSHHRARLDEAARDGVPVHVTVLYPFLPPAGISEPLLASLGKLFAGFAAFEFTLDRVGWFSEEVVWLGPRDPAPFSALTRVVFTAFPCCPPHGGQPTGSGPPAPGRGAPCLTPQGRADPLTGAPPAAARRSSTPLTLRTPPARPPRHSRAPSPPRLPTCAPRPASPAFTSAPLWRVADSRQI